MIIFGGSPMRVAVPPIFEANISVIKYGTGSISSCLAMANVTGIIKITVVTLSRKALAIAVKTANATKIRIGLPPVCFSNSFAIKLNIPLCAAICTITIIEISKNITLKSIKLAK